MSYDFSKIKDKGEDVKEWLKKELVSLRTGRATPALVDSVVIDSYGSKVPLKTVSSISIEDARTIRITPWDHSLLKSIEHAIVSSSLGIQPITDKDSVRVIMPELTEERRKSLAKALSGKLEDSKISLRQERDEVWNDIKEKEKNGEIPEDDKFRFKDDLQKIIDDTTKSLEEIADKKKEEIAG